MLCAAEDFYSKLPGIMVHVFMTGQFHDAVPWICHQNVNIHKTAQTGFVTKALQRTIGVVGSA